MIGDLRESRPLVSLIVTPCDPPEMLLRSLRSAAGGDYSNLQILLANDGREGLKELAALTGDPRVVVCPPSEGAGPGQVLQTAADLAGGDYVAYLMGGDIHYTFHVRSLLAVLEGSADAQVAFGGFYKTYCKLSGKAEPMVMGKALAWEGDFDRWLLCRGDCIRLSAVMHRRELAQRAGGFDGQLPAMVEWDFLRRLAFYSDFTQVPQVTGEHYYYVVGGPSPGAGPTRDVSDEVAPAIRAKRPPKPWAKMPDLSILLAPCHGLAARAAMLEGIRRHTFVPHRIYLPTPKESPSLDLGIPNVVSVPVTTGAPVDARIDKALACCDGDYVAVIIGDVLPGPAWVEFPLHSLIKASSRGAMAIPNQPEGLWTAVMERQQFLHARRANPALTIRRSLQAAGIAPREPAEEDHPFACRRMLAEVRRLQQDGDWRRSADICLQAEDSWREAMPLHRQALRALYRLGRQEEALKLSAAINRRQPSVQTLLVEGKLLRRANRTHEAVAILREAHAALTRG